MVKSNQMGLAPGPGRPARALRDTRFANARLAPVGVEVLTLAELHARVQARRLLGPERLEFFLVLVVHQGRGEHLVDFAAVDLVPGRVVCVRPGQVQEWRAGGACQADVLLVEPAALRPGGAAPADATADLLRLQDWPSAFDLDADALAACRQLLALLGRELAPAPATPLSAALARQLLLCTLLAIARAAQHSAAARGAPNALAQRFMAELERRVAARPAVDALAGALGVSTSTLNRACRQHFGQAAKPLVDRRVALEAQRLLVHTDATSVAIGEQLGFTEPTNFLKFFRRRVGTTPEAFRRAHRPGPGGG